MAMTLKVKGLDEYMAALSSLGADTEKIVSEAMFDGAGILIEECKKNIQALPVEDGYMQPGIKRNCVTTSEKEDLLKSIIANPVDALARANYIGILFWAVVFGVALKPAAPATA